MPESVYDRVMIRSQRRLVLLTVIGWLSMVGVDFILHAGLLAGLYLEPSPFLLPPLTAFSLIPIGYVSLFLAAFLLVWLMDRQGIIGWRQGTLFGIKLGALAWGSFVLGLLSISTASLSILLGWFIGQTLELAIAGAVIGSGFAGTGLRRLFGVVIVFLLLSVITTIVLQSMGVVPTIRIR